MSYPTDEAWAEPMDGDFEAKCSDFHDLQKLLKSLDSYLDMDLKHRELKYTCDLLRFARKTVKSIVERMENDIVADVIYSDNKDRN